jgi:hypothetical protein
MGDRLLITAQITLYHWSNYGYRFKATLAGTCVINDYYDIYDRLDTQDTLEIYNPIFLPMQPPPIRNSYCSVCSRLEKVFTLLPEAV